MKKILVLLLAIVLLGVGCEREGTIKTSDCREEIELKENDLTTFLKDFTCDYTKTENGKILNGECYSVKIKNGECRTVWSYEKKSEVNCSKEFPFAGYDSKCYKEWASGRVYVAE